MSNAQKKLDDIRVFITYYLSYQKAQYIMELIEEYGAIKDLEYIKESLDRISQ